MCGSFVVIQGEQQRKYNLKSTLKQIQNCLFNIYSAMSLYEFIFLCNASDFGGKTQEKQNTEEHTVSRCLNTHKKIK